MSKKATIWMIVLGVIILLIGGIFFFLNKPKSEPQKDQNEYQADAPPQSIEPTEIGLELIASADKKKVQFSLSKLDDAKTIEYELTYEANSTKQEQSEGGDTRIQRGITGEAKLKPGTGTYTSPELDLGSCSKNVCRYDTGVESVNILLKITRTNGKIYVVEQKLALE